MLTWYVFVVCLRRGSAAAQSEHGTVPSAFVVSFCCVRRNFEYVCRLYAPRPTAVSIYPYNKLLARLLWSALLAPFMRAVANSMESYLVPSLSLLSAP